MPLKGTLAANPSPQD